MNIDKALGGQLPEMLRTVDLVKFAKAEPPATFHTDSMENVRNFIEQTKKAPSVEEEEATDAPPVNHNIRQPNESEPPNDGLEE